MTSQRASSSNKKQAGLPAGLAGARHGANRHAKMALHSWRAVARHSKEVPVNVPTG